MGRKGRRTRAFSFIEMMLTVFLVTICAGIVATAMPTATVGRQKSVYRNRAVALAQKQMEAIKRLGYPNITANALLNAGLIDSATEVATNTYSFTNVDSLVADDAPRLLPSGTARITLEQPDIELKRVIIRITWSENSQTKTYEIGTLVANL